MIKNHQVSDILYYVLLNDTIEDGYETKEDAEEKIQALLDEDEELENITVIKGKKLEVTSGVEIIEQ